MAAMEVRVVLGPVLCLRVTLLALVPTAPVPGVVMGARQRAQPLKFFFLKKEVVTLSTLTSGRECFFSISLGRGLGMEAARLPSSQESG